MIFVNAVSVRAAIFTTRSFSEIHVHHEVFDRGTNLVSVLLLAGESPVGVAICNNDWRVLCTYLDGLGMLLVVAISIQKWDARFSGGYYKVWIIVSHLDTEKLSNVSSC